MSNRRKRRFHLALAAATAAALAGVTATALGGSGVGSVLNLGRANSVDRQTILQGSAGVRAQLRVRNTGRGPALEAVVRPGMAPLRVNSDARVANLNADSVDGIDSAAFQRRVTGTCPAGSAVRIVNAEGAVTCQASWSLNGNAGTSASSFLGTTQSQPLILRTNNVEALRVDPTGNVGVGTASPGARLEALAATGAIGLMGTSSARGVIGRLGPGVSCPGTYGVGGCAGDTGGAGVFADATTGIGVVARSNSNRAVEGFSDTGIGVIGDSTTRGVIGTLGRTSCAGTYAVGACGTTLGDGLVARSSTGAAVRAETDTGQIFVGSGGGNQVARIDATGKGFFNGGTQTGGADYADSMRATRAAALEPGDVLAIDPAHPNAVRKSREPGSTLVAGVYSTRPAVLGVGRHRIGDSLAGEVPVALVGIVPTKVTAANGPVRPGDLLTTSGTPGHAMKAAPVVVRGVRIYPTGAILGKALESLQVGTGVINVLVTLR